MGKKEVDEVMAKLFAEGALHINRPIPMPRENQIALVVMFGMLNYSGSLEKRLETREKLRELATKEWDRRYGGTTSPRRTDT